jgi:FdhE protein
MSAAGRIAKPIDIGRVANPPPVLPPDRSQVFRRRARRRFDRLAAGSTIADFLSFMAAIAAVQSAALASLPASVAPETPLSYSTSPFDRRNWRSDGSWRNTLTMICNRAGCAVADRPNSCRALRLARLDAEGLNRLAEADLFLEIGEAERAAGCLAFAPLQVHWTRLAGLIDATDFQTIDQPGACPVCGSPPVASLVHCRRQACAFWYARFARRSGTWCVSNAPAAPLLRASPTLRSKAQAGWSRQRPATNAEPIRKSSLRKRTLTPRSLPII